MTESEELVWERIRKKQLQGMRFRRQVSIGGYVVDFYCPRLRLAIEIDGSSHDRLENREYDALREETLTELGVHVLRFRNEQVVGELDLVAREIAAVTAKLQSERPEPFPLTKGKTQKGSRTQ